MTLHCFLSFLFFLLLWVQILRGTPTKSTRREVIWNVLWCDAILLHLLFSWFLFSFAYMYCLTFLLFSIFRHNFFFINYTTGLYMCISGVGQMLIGSCQFLWIAVIHTLKILPANKYNMGKQNLLYEMKITFSKRRVQPWHSPWDCQRKGPKQAWRASQGTCRPAEEHGQWRWRGRGENRAHPR